MVHPTTEPTPFACEEQLAEIDVRLKSLDEQPADGDGNLRQAGTPPQCADRGNELQAVKADLEALRVQFDEQRRQWEAERNEWNVHRAAEAEQLALRQMELNAQCAAFEAEKAAWKLQQATAQKKLDDRAAGLDALRVDLDSQQAAWEKARRQCQPPRQEAAARLPDAAPRPATEPCSDSSDPPAVSQPAEPEGPSEPVAADDAAANSPTPARTGAPVDLAEILRRNGFQLDDAESETPPSENAKSEIGKDVTAARGKSEPSSSITAPIQRAPTPVEREEDEASIDDYMTRLLARNRGEAAPATATRPAAVAAQKTPVAAPVAAAPKPAPAPAVPTPAPQPAKPGEPVVLARRTTTAEKTVDFRAMRQLANLSANTAISRHESKQLRTNTRNKLVVTVLACVVGIVMLVIYATTRATLLTIGLAVASFAVAGLWGKVYLEMSKRMQGEREAHVDRYLKQGEESAAAKLAKSPKAVEPAPSEETPATES